MQEIVQNKCLKEGEDKRLFPSSFPLFFCEDLLQK